MGIIVFAIAYIAVLMLVGGIASRLRDPWPYAIAFGFALALLVFMHYVPEIPR